MTEQAKQLVTSSAPWKRGVPWPIILVEGVIAAAIGIYILVDPSNARSRVLQLIGLILLINGALEVLAGFRNDELKASPYRILRGTIAATVGLIITLEPISDYLDDDAERWILGLGMTAVGLVGLAIVAISRDEGGLRIGPLITNLLFILIAILLFTGDEENDSRMKLFGIASLVLGVLLCLYSLYLYRAKQGAALQASATGPGGSPQAPTPKASA
jgi:uncharacterized membrane protein HdeD (DUF308 family)